MESGARNAQGRAVVVNRALLNGDVLFTRDTSPLLGSPLYNSEFEMPRAEQQTSLERD